MTVDDQEIRDELKKVFLLELEEHIETISRGLLALESEDITVPEDETIQTIYRSFHSLKGAARAVENRQIETLCQDGESILKDIKTGAVILGEDIFDQLHGFLNRIENARSATDEEESGTEAPPPVVETSAPPQAESSAPASLQSPAPEDAVASPAPQGKDDPSVEASEFIRMAPAVIEQLSFEMETLIPVRISMQQQRRILVELSRDFSNHRKQARTLSQELLDLEQLLKLHPDLNAPALASLERIRYIYAGHEEAHQTLESTTRGLAMEADRETRTFGAMVQGLQETVQRVLLQPLSAITLTLGRTVREIGRSQGKTIQFLVAGDEIRIDRRLLMKVYDPLLHIIRNAVDHGIESAEEREAAGKPKKASLYFDVTPIGNDRIRILIRDDGQGLDPEVLRAKALALGVESKAVIEAWTPEECLAQVFRSDFSTRTSVSTISGRGMGLAIAKDVILEVGGQINLQSIPGSGTTFLIELPVTQTTNRGVLLDVEGRRFAIPTTFVTAVRRIRPSDIQRSGGFETIEINGVLCPTILLRDLVGVPRDTKGSPTHYVALSIRAGDQEATWLVNNVLGEQELLVRRLGPMLQNVEGISGGVIREDGSVIPVLAPAELLGQHSVSSKAEDHEAVFVTARQPRILVVEDSITSRTLLKNVLTSEGYDVTLVVDGMAALGRLRDDTFDLMISDIEMPLLNGLDLTKRVRENEALRDLPIILVTSLASDADRRRGMEVGANAYIGKNSFDQSDLLDAIRRLVGA